MKKYAEVICSCCGKQSPIIKYDGEKSIEELSDILIGRGWNSYYNVLYCNKCVIRWHKYIKKPLWGENNTRRVIRKRILDTEKKTKQAAQRYYDA